MAGSSIVPRGTRLAFAHALLASLLALALHAGESAPGQAWRGARWGMGVEEVLASFPGEASRLPSEVKLEDGHVVSAGIERFDLGGVELRVRFVFSQSRLALVSLRTPPQKPVDAAVYDKLRRHLAEALGGAGEESKDDNFVDMRQTRWERGTTRIDLKYIPGTVVVLYSPITK